MNVKVEIEKQDNWHRVLNIEVSAEDADREYEKVAQRVARKVKVKGFRKGKVPVQIVRKSFKAELDQEFLEYVVPQAFDHALKETGLDPVTEPKFEELSYGAERPLSFKADFESRPEIGLKEYKGLKAEKQVPEVSEEYLESVVEDFRKSKSTLEEVERGAIDGDVLVLDYHAIDDEEKPIPGREVKDYSLELGAGRVVAQFEEVLKGAAAGESRTAEVPYPEDYEDERLAGQTARYRILVCKVQEKRYPELTDELVAAHSELKTVEELRARVRENLADQADRAGVERLEHVLLEQVVDAHPFEPPATLVEQLLADLVQRQRHEMEQAGGDPASVEEAKVREEAAAPAAKQVRRMLVMDALAAEENIEVTDKDLGERVAIMAHMHGHEPRKFVEQMGGNRFLRRLSREIRDKKVLAFLVENAEITVTKVPAQPSETT